MLLLLGKSSFRHLKIIVVVICELNVSLVSRFDNKVHILLELSFLHPVRPSKVVGHQNSFVDSGGFEVEILAEDVVCSVLSSLTLGTAVGVALAIHTTLTALVIRVLFFILSLSTSLGLF